MRMRKRAPLLLLLALIALTGCRFAEHSRRVASDALASFVLESLLRIQTPLAQGTVQRSSLPPAPQVHAAAPAATVAPPPVEVAACPLTKREVLPLVRTAFANAQTVAAAELPRVCSKSKRIVFRYRAPDAKLAEMQIELSFAVAETAQFRQQRMVVLKTEAL